MTEPTTESFLNEMQLEGRAKEGDTGSGFMSLEAAMAQVSQIADREVLAAYGGKDESEWPTLDIAVYCHDCRRAVPIGQGQTLRGNPRKVCGLCHSKRISGGSPAGIKTFYHLNEDGIREGRPSRKERPKPDPKAPTKEIKDDLPESVKISLSAAPEKKKKRRRRGGKGRKRRPNLNA